MGCQLPRPTAGMGCPLVACCHTTDDEQQWHQGCHDIPNMLCKALVELKPLAKLVTYV